MDNENVYIAQRIKEGSFLPKLIPTNIPRLHTSYIRITIEPIDDKHSINFINCRGYIGYLPSRKNMET